MFNRLKLMDIAQNRRVNDPLAIIIAPTRELAIQIFKDAEILNKGCDFRLCLAYGGTD